MEQVSFWKHINFDFSEKKVFYDKTFLICQFINVSLPHERDSSPTDFKVIEVEVSRTVLSR